MPIRLALSLHAPEDALRSKIMPINERYSIAEVLAACEAYYARRKPQGVRRVRDARRRQRLLRPGGPARAAARTRAIYKLNLIPYNPTDSVYDGSSRGAIDAFKAALEEHGLRATVRLTRGRDIDAACGQLAARR